MLPGPPTKLKCPHCGGRKYIESISSGNTLQARIWSDYKHEYPMLPHPSPIQRCPKCGKYYFYQDSIPKENIFQWIGRQIERFYINFIDDGTYVPKEQQEIDKNPDLREQIFLESHLNGFGNLSFDEMNEAYEQLFSSRLSEKKKQILIIEWLYAFNDHFNGRNQLVEWDIIPEKILERQQIIIEEAIKRVDRDTIMVGELYREAGRFEDCIKAIGDIAQYKGMDENLASMIIEHAQRADRRVFQIR